MLSDTQKNKSIAAIKVVQRAKLNRKLLENLESEIQILKKLNHPHIVALTDCKKTDKYIHLIMEYCSVGDLSHIIKKRERLDLIHPCLEGLMHDYPPVPGSGLHEVVVRHFLKQLASALEYLRKDGLVHRDVKPQNLLLDPPPGWDGHVPENPFPLEGSRALVGLPSLPILKLADFGFARVLPATSMAETLCGSPLYMAPEILRYEKYDATADLWSVGTVLYEMIAGRPPFRAPNHVDLLRKIEARNDKIDFPRECIASDDIRGLVRSLLKRNPLERMSFQEFFDHPVVRGEIPGAAVNAPAPLVSEVVVRPRSSLAAIRTEAMPMRRSPSLRTPRDERALGADREGTGRSAPDHHYIPPSPRARTAVESSALPFATLSPSGASPRLVERRLTTQVPSAGPSSPAFERPQSRPSLTNHATAPARQGWNSGRDTGAVPMERVHSRGTDPSPGSSLLVQRGERVERIERGEPARDRHSQRSPSGRDMRPVEEEHGEKEDYVFIDKQYVQVNSFADEIATRGAGRTTPSPSSSALSRRIPSRAIAVTNRRPEVQSHSKGSYDRRYGSSPGRSTLAKALEIANARLFGVSVSPPSQSPPNMQSGYPPQPNPGSMVMLSNAGGLAEDDMMAIQTIEDAASRSDVVYNFAEVKWAQLVPSAPSAPRGLGLLPSSGSAGDLVFGGESSPGSSDMHLTPDAVVQLAEEALVLYVKALGLLSKAMEFASNWWSTSNSRPGSMSPAAQMASARINNVVQWVRERFNEVLEKAEFVRIKLMNAQKELPRSHPSHPRNNPDNDDMGAGTENVAVTPGVTAEKLMYDRALEMSNAAAVNELIGEDLNGCEVAYVTSIRMLEAVLERDSSENEADGGQMEEEDRRIVEKCEYFLSLVYYKPVLTLCRHGRHSCQTWLFEEEVCNDYVKTIFWNSVHPLQPRLSASTLHVSGHGFGDGDVSEIIPRVEIITFILTFTSHKYSEIVSE